MDFFRITKDWPFMRYAKGFNVISTTLFVLSVVFLVTKGLNFSVEFTGGVIVEARYSEAANLSAVRQALGEQGIEDPQVQNFGTSQDILIRLANKDLQDSSLGKEGKIDQSAIQSLVLEQGGPGVQLMRVEFVGPQVGRELAENGLIALLIVIAGIMIYLAMRFEWKFSIAAIVANLHDVLIILGFFAFFQWEFSLAVLAAVLAVLGYSVNESVVVFDRIRETFKINRRLTVPETIDRAITRTMSRTVITHGSTQLMVCSMLIFGGPTLHYFALALTIGILFGIYSSIMVASPMVMWLGVTREDLVPKPKKENPEELLD